MARITTPAAPASATSAARETGTPAKPSGGNAFLGLPNVEWNSRTTTALVADTLYYTPFAVLGGVTVTEAYLEVSAAGAASSVLRLAIYNADTDWQPTTLVSDIGTVAVDATGVKSVTGLSLALSTGRYLLRSHTNGAPTVRTAAGGDALVGAVSQGFGLNCFITSMTVGRAYGVAETPGTVWTTAATGGSPGITYPAFLKWTVTA